MRVISGAAGGIPLSTPDDEARPTTDRVRETLFSILGDVSQLATLDLFGGCGSLGIEALSRGAASVTFIEAKRGNARLIETNLSKTRLSGGRVINRDVFAWLKQDTAVYSLIFADPPWKKKDKDRDFSRELLADPHLPGRLDTGGLFVLEEYSREPAWNAPDPWVQIREKVVGDTRLRFFRNKFETDTADS